jgi:hypothetical protein
MSGDMAIWLAMGVGICLAPALLVGVVAGVRWLFIVFGALLFVSPGLPFAYCALFPSRVCAVLPWLSFIAAPTLTPAGVVILLVGLVIPSKNRGGPVEVAKPSENNGA